MANGQSLDAFKNFSLACQLNPSDPTLHYNCGTAAEDMSQWAEAKSSYETTVSLDKDDVQAHVKLGVMCMKLNEVV